MATKNILKCLVTVPLKRKKSRSHSHPASQAVVLLAKLLHKCLRIGVGLTFIYFPPTKTTTQNISTSKNYKNAFDVSEHSGGDNLLGDIFCVMFFNLSGVVTVQ
jgi:hypothetical protein